MYGKTKHIHFVGIGGIGMSGIAELLANLGYRVSGSDLRRSKITDRLSALGCTVFEGHDSKWIEGAEVIVASSAIAKDNPEILAARDNGIPVVMRAEKGQVRMLVDDEKELVYDTGKDSHNEKTNPDHHYQRDFADGTDCCRLWTAAAR